jgi:hypothetical protein
VAALLTAPCPLPARAVWLLLITSDPCRHSSSIAFHLLGLKCSGCGSYNTRRMGLHTSDGSPLENAGRLGRLDGDGGAAAAAAAAGGGAGLVPDLAQNLLQVRGSGRPCIPKPR